MLTSEEEIYSRYLNGRYRWLTTDASPYLLENTTLPDDVARTEFYPKEWKDSFGLLSALRARDIPSIIQISLRKLDLRGYDPRSIKASGILELDSIMAEEEDWFSEQYGLFSSQEELLIDDQLHAAILQYQARDRFCPVGYVQTMFYADPEALIVAYGNEGIKVLPKEETTAILERGRRTREALQSGNPHAIAELFIGCIEEANRITNGKLDLPEDAKKELSQVFADCVEIRD